MKSALIPRISCLSISSFAIIICCFKKLSGILIKNEEIGATMRTLSDPTCSPSTIMSIRVLSERLSPSYTVKNDQKPEISKRFCLLSDSRWTEWRHNDVTRSLPWLASQPVSGVQSICRDVYGLVVIQTWSPVPPSSPRGLTPGHYGMGMRFCTSLLLEWLSWPP